MEAYHPKSLSSTTIRLPEPVDVHGLGGGEKIPHSLPATVVAQSFISSSSSNGASKANKKNDDDDDDDNSGSRYIVASSASSSCFDIFAGLWVFLYEKYVPEAQRETQQNCLLDDLYASMGKLRARKNELHTKLRNQVLEAKNMSKTKKDFVRNFLKNKMVSIKRTKVCFEVLFSTT